MGQGLAATQAFFGPRAATWDERFADDGPKFADAVGHLQLVEGGAVIDAGCGTGRALPHLRRLVGTTGAVIGLDATPEMCARAHRHGLVILGDAGRLPVRDDAVDAVFAAGLLTHLPDPHAGLAELARVTRPGGGLVLFHPIGRAALAQRHGHDLSPDDIRDPANLPAALAATGWELVDLDDTDDHYVAAARRR